MTVPPLRSAAFTRSARFASAYCLGETPVAAVLLREGAAVGAGELRDWINDRVGARYQRLHAVQILDDFPRNAAGKTLKRTMRDAYRDETNAER